MKIVDLLEQYSAQGRDELDAHPIKTLDAPVAVSNGRLVMSKGNLHLYQFEIPQDRTLLEDVPLTLLPPGSAEPTEGYVMACQGSHVWIQTFDAIGQTIASCMLVPDTAGFFETVAKRLQEMAQCQEKYSLGPAERLVPWFNPDATQRPRVRTGVGPASIVTTNWGADVHTRRNDLINMGLEAIQANKRILLISPSHAASDEMVALLGQRFRKAGLQYKSVMTRYEFPLQHDMAGFPLLELGFEAQMHQFYAKSRNEKANLRKKYNRFRELTPILVYKAEKQKDLDEVKLLEWRLLTELSGLQNKIKDIDKLVAQYEAIPLLKRLAMQTVGKNIKTMGEYRIIYEAQMKTAMKELDIAQARIAELRPEAAVARDMRPEFEELKEEVVRLGGTKKIREMLAAEEGTNRQAFIQNKRLLATTAARVVMDPLFTRTRFDLLLVDEAPEIAAPFIVAAAGLIRERIVLSGDPQRIPEPKQWGVLYEHVLSPSQA